jgi:hypothetical protein
VYIPWDPVPSEISEALLCGIIMQDTQLLHCWVWMERRCTGICGSTWSDVTEVLCVSATALVESASVPGCWQGYPRLLIENRIYSSRVFRKLHLEVAVRQDGLQVLHMVFFPR